MDLEDIYLPTAFILLTLSFSIFIAVEVPDLYKSLHLGFLHFVLSLILMGASMVFVALDYFLGWGRPYEPPTFASNENVRTKPIVNKPSPRKHRRKTVHSNIDPPTKEQLQRLKEALDIGEGSIQYKKRGQGVYHVTYRIYVPKNELAINNEFHTVKQIYVANYGLPADGKFDPMQYSSSWRFLTGLIKKWFINSIFRDSVPLFLSISSTIETKPWS